jgi:hypothetical protein
MEQIVFKRQIKKQLLSKWVVDDQNSSVSISEIDEKKLFSIPEDPESLEIDLEDTNDEITNILISQFSSVISNVELQDQLLGEDSIEELSSEEQKIALGEEHFDSVYTPTRARSNGKSESDKLADKVIEEEQDKLLKKIEISDHPNKRKIDEAVSNISSSEDELFEDDFEIQEFQPNKKQKVDDSALSIARLKEKNKNQELIQKIESPSSGKSNSSSDHKLFEKEKSKPQILRNKLTQTPEFRKLVRDQMNQFKINCENFKSSSHNKNFEKK